MRRQLGAQPALHLLEVGVRWPPESFLRWKFEGLAARGVRVTVASRSIIDPTARLRGVELLELPQRGAPRTPPGAVILPAAGLMVTSPGRFTRLLRGIRRMPPGYRRRYGGVLGLLAMYLPVARVRPDVVHFEWNHSAALYMPMFEVWGCPVVISAHGTEISADPHLPGHEGFAELLPKLLRASSAVHCVSQSLCDLIAELGVPKDRLRVIHQGVDPGVFCPRAACPIPDDTPLRVIVIGWPRWVKGFEWALQAIRLLIESGVPARLEVLGADPSRDVGEHHERERLRHTVADLGLGEHVALREPVSSEEVAVRLQGSDVLLLPSLDEGLPTVVLEGMACGIPVVATDCGGVSEALRNGVEGWLVPPRDSAALASALERLWRDPEMRERMGAAGRATVTSRFTLERQLEEFLALYDEVVRT